MNIPLSDVAFLSQERLLINRFVSISNITAVAPLVLVYVSLSQIDSCTTWFNMAGKNQTSHRKTVEYENELRCTIKRANKTLGYLATLQYRFNVYLIMEIILIY